MSRSSWILSAIDQLNAHGSWTGRIHIQKLLYLCRELVGSKHPFEFDLYRFGPYSFQLDSDLRDLTALGIVHQQVIDEGYGPSHRPVSDWKRLHGLGSLPAEEQAKLLRVAELVGNRNSGELELIATCLWAERNEHLPSDELIVDWVNKVKPRYSKDDIAQALGDLRSIERQVQTAETAE